MDDETIVAVFDTSEHAAAAVRDLEQAGIPASAITQHAGATSTEAEPVLGSPSQTGLGTSTTVSGDPLEQRGFWSSLFGAEPEYGHDTTVYDRSLESGSTVVTVRGSAGHLDKVLDILERHHPIDIDERAAAYGMAQTRPIATGPIVKGPIVTGASTAKTETGGAGYGRTGVGAVSGEPGTLSLSEETFAVGKRAVNRGTTRVRRYVVETPVEETVSLRDERVTVERRPVTDGRPVTNADFSDKTIEMTETAEEAVISKQARVREEVVIRKDATEHSETIRDTVRREDVEITRDDGERAGVAQTGGVSVKPKV